MTLEEALEKIEALSGNVEKLQGDLKTSEEKREFALSESKKNAEKYKSLRSEQEKKETDDAKKAEDYEKLYNGSLSKIEGLEKNLASQVKDNINDKLTAAFAAEGVNKDNMSIALKLADTSAIKSLDDGRICPESIGEIVNGTKTSAQGLNLFKVDVPATKGAPPAGNPEGAKKQPSFQDEGMKVLEGMGAV